MTLSVEQSRGPFHLSFVERRTAIETHFGHVFGAYAMTAYHLRLGEILMKSGRVTQEDIDRALALAAKSKRRLGEALIELEVISDLDVAKALAQQHALPFVDLEQTYMVNAESLSLIPHELMRKWTVLPLGKTAGRIRVLTHDPVDVELIDSLRFRLGCEVEVFVGARGQIRRYIDKLPQNV